MDADKGKWSLRAKKYASGKPALRSIQTGRDSTTRREFSVLKKKKSSTNKNFTKYVDQIAKSA
jgi:hypothetical protein